MDNTFKVDFFCVGVAKAGTTTLHDLLSIQDNLSLPKRKETNYFSFGVLGKPAFTGPLDNSSVNEPTITSFEEYVNDFDHEPGDLIGEICPSYTLDGAAANIYEHNPDAKIIILLREPVSRAYSNYQHLVRDGREHGTFEEALAAEADRLNEGWEWFWGLKNNSRYYDVVKEYVEKQHVKAVMEFIGMDPAMARIEEFNSNKSGVVAGQWRFLHKILLSEGGLNSILRAILPQFIRKRLGQLFKRISTVKGAVSVETKQALSDEFSEDLTLLNDLVDGRVTQWLGDRHVS